MQALSLCWMLDNRWLCTIRNKLNQYLLMIPIIADMATITGTLVQRNQSKLDISGWIIIIFIVYGLTVIVSLLAMIRVAVIVNQYLQDVTQNEDTIKQFSNNAQTKQIVWSWWGLLILLLSIAQIVVNKIYINHNIDVSACLTNQIRFWIDIGCLGYIGLIVILFLVFKLCFLLISWRNPQFYLRYKDVI